MWVGVGCVCIFCIIMFEHLSIYALFFFFSFFLFFLSLFFFFFFSFFKLDNNFHLDVHYVCMPVQRFEPQGRRFTKLHYYYTVTVFSANHNRNCRINHHSPIHAPEKYAYNSAVTICCAATAGVCSTIGRDVLETVNLGQTAFKVQSKRRLLDFKRIAAVFHVDISWCTITMLRFH